MSPPISLLAASAYFAAALVPRPPQVAATLRPDQRVEQVMRSGEGVAFAAVLDREGVLPLVVRQQGIGVVVTVTGPEGAPLVIDVSSDSAWGDEPASVGPAPGRYLVELRAREDPAAATGRVVIETGALGPADANARRRLEAERALAAAARSAQEARSPEGVTAALAQLEGALSTWRALGDEYWTYVAALRLADVQVGLTPPAALDTAHEAIEGFRALGRDAERAAALHTASIALYYVGEREAALAPGLEARDILRELRDAAAEAAVLDDLGMVYLEMGRVRDSRDAREEALRLARAVGGREREAAALANLGVVYWFTGEIDEAHDLFVLAGAALREQGNLLGAAATAHNVAFCQMFLGETAKAEQHLREALPFCRGAADRPCEANVLQLLAMNLDQQDRPAEALRYYEEARAIRRELEDKEAEAWLLVCEAMTHRRRGARERAVELAGIAEGIYGGVGGWKLAALLDLQGQLAADGGELAGAEARHRAALQLRTAIGDREGQAVSLLRLARLARAHGRPEEARAQAERAVELLEAIRGRVRSPERRMGFMMGTAFWPSLRDAYEELADALMEMHAADGGRGYDALAFEAGERSRARVLQEALSQSREAPRAAAAPGAPDELRALEDEFAFKLDEQVRVLSGTASADERRRLAAELEALEQDLEQARIRALAAAPRADAWTAAPRTSLREVQAEMLDADTVLLEYSLGERRSHLWAVTATSLRSFALAPRSSLEEAVRAAHAAVGSEPANPGEGTAELANLGRLLLGPVAPLLAGRRLVVVPDGALHYVPFGALPDPAEPSRPIAAGHELVALPSASTLAALRARRTPARSFAGTVAVLADPVYDADDERLGRRRAGRRAAAQARPSGDASTRAVEALGFEGPIPRLPFTRREASSIRTIAPAGAALVALDFDASRPALMDPKLSRYRIVHVAAHGLVNAARPELSGILLSLFDRDGRPQPGFFTAGDALGLDLPADLVVLSGCRTALGREMKGEGIVGLTRGFLYAGAQRVVASLWKVDDAATAALMERFYRALLGPRRLPPAAALRAAQLELRSQPRFRHPYYWAGFQLVGEWR